MSEREAFEKAIAAAQWDDELIRGVFADWLDEHGEHEEADRQRRYVPAERWLRAFAEKHTSDFGSWQEGEVRWDNVECPYGRLMYFLRQHADGGGYLSFETPYGFSDYSNDLWRNYEIVTGEPAPEGEYRHAMPPFRCSC